jgi:hypothetical protein
MKSILIIAYHFPPEAAVGATRPANFAKFLPEHGWQPAPAPGLAYGNKINLDEFSAGTGDSTFAFLI